MRTNQEESGTKRSKGIRFSVVHEEECSFDFTRQVDGTTMKSKDREVYIVL